MMMAARIHGPGQIAVEAVPIPIPQAGEVLIQVHRVGLCGTDVGVFHGYVPAAYPVTSGHEFSGVIARLGGPDDTLREGDPVVVAGGWGCGTCALCARGRGLYCKRRVSLGRNTDGCLAEYIKVTRRAVYRLPPNVSLDEGQNFVNIACVVRAFKKVPLQLGKTGVVFGPGNAGLIMLQMLKMAGAHRVAMVGTRDFRLKMAETLGAAHTVNVRREDPAQGLAKWYPEGFDTVVEASGSVSALQGCFDVVRPGGAVIVFGMFAERLKDFDPAFLYYKEPTIYGCKGAAGAFEEALHLLEGKRLEILPLITHRFPLAETPAAFKTFEDKTPEAMRIVIEVPA